jgi:hypothetical protein
MTSKTKTVRMKRTIADRFLAGVKERVKEINSSNQYVYRVARLVVFGSYVNEPEKQNLGDLDLGVQLAPKTADRGEHQRKCRAKEQECPSSDWLLAMDWAEEEVYRRIRNHNAYISVHIMSQTENKAIFSKKVMEIDCI